MITKENEIIEGSKAYNFLLEVDTGKTVSLEDYKEKNLILYFYPKDDTPGCTIEAKDFASLYPKFQEYDTEILGISKDNIKSHKKFKEKYCLPFDLGYDIESKVSQNYGCWVEKSMYGKKYMGISRTTFLIDKNQIIKKIWSNVSVSGHALQVLNAIQELI
jgi:peroxiredoxin Q/BCP